MSSRFWGVHVARRQAICLVIIATGSASALCSASGEDAVRPQPLRRIVVRLSADVLAPLIDKPIERRVPVEDVILGTRVTGEAHVQGRPVLEVRDDVDSASFTVRLSGTVHSRTVGRNGPAIIHSRCETEFTATKRVIYQPGQGFVAEPATVSATTRSTTDKVASTRRGAIGRVVVRKAWEQIDATRLETEAIVCERTEQRISTEFDQLLESRLARVNRTADVRLAVAAILGDGHPQYACSTSGGCLQIAASSGKADVAVILPPLRQAAATAQIWVHDSVVGYRLAQALKQLDRVRRSVESIFRTLDIVPSAIASTSRLSDRSRSPMNPIDYATTDDWIVLQLGGQLTSETLTTARR